MRFYWKMVVVCAVAELTVVALISGLSMGLAAAGGTLLAALAGVRLVPLVDRLRNEQVWHVVGLLTIAAVALGIGGMMHWSLLIGLGFFGLLVLPCASAAQDECQLEKDRRERFA